MALCVVLSAVVLLQVAWGVSGSATSTPGVSWSPSAIGLVSAAPTDTFSATPSPTPLTTPTPTTTPSPSPSASATPSAAPSPTPSAGASTSGPSARPSARLPSPPPPSPTPTPTPTNRPWQADPALVQAKIDGRVIVDSSGHAVILRAAPKTPDYAAAAFLDTRWSGLIQEPPKTGKDDKGTAYTDDNYALFCGPGTAAVVLYYWPASRKAVMTTHGYFVEPVDRGANHYARTYWAAEDAGGNARGMIQYMAEVEWPAPDAGLSWWSLPGLLNWGASKPATSVENLADAINWEASGRSRTNYFYVIVPASQLTAATLLDHVHADIGMGVPVVVAVRTSNGKVSLPDWRVRSAKYAGNHFVTIVGYDDTSGTYAVMDTCGLTCNNRNVRGGVGNISQSALFALIRAESDNDGILW